MGVKFKSFLDSLKTQVVVCKEPVKRVNPVTAVAPVKVPDAADGKRFRVNRLLARCNNCDHTPGDRSE